MLDFGLARTVDHQVGITVPGSIVGTPGYMALEQINGEPLDARVDLFSLGCVLYRLTTRTMPFQGKNMMAVLLAIVLFRLWPPSGECWLVEQT